MDLSPLCRVYTKEIFISKGSYGYGESRNVFHYLVQKPHLPVQSGKLSSFIGVGIRLRTETCVNWDGPIAMVPCFNQGNVCMKRNLLVWRVHKCVPLVGAETPLTCDGPPNYPSHGGSYRAKNRNLCELGWTYCHGTVFAPRECLYQNEATGMESPEMYSTSRCRNPTYL